MSALLAALEEGEGVVTGQVFTDEDLSALGVADLGHVEFEETSFERCTFTQIAMHRASFSGCRLHECDLTGASLRNSYWRACRLEDCRAVGADFWQSYVGGSLVAGGNFSYTNFAESKFEKLTMRGVDLSEAALSQLKLRGGRDAWVLDNCDLTRAELFLTRLRGVSLAGNQIASIRVSDTFSELVGAKIEPDQAIDLVGLLGVKLVEG